MKALVAFSEKEPFKKPPISPKGDDSVDTIHRWMGVCLSTWEAGTEDGFANIYSTLVSNPRSGGAERAYAMMTSVSARKKLLEGAAEVFFIYKSEDAALKDRLRNLLLLYGYASSRRNEIAHGVAQGWYNDGHYVGPSTKSKARALDTMPSYLYNGQQLEDFNAKFSLLGREAHKLANDLSAARYVQEYLRETSQDKSREQHPQQENG